MSGKQKKRERAVLKERMVSLEKEASLGNLDAQVDLAYMYCNQSKRNIANLKKALYLLKQAADQGHEEGLTFMAELYSKGYVISGDDFDGARYLYHFHKKLDTEHYRLWVGCGLDEEDFVDYAKHDRDKISAFKIYQG